LARQTRKEEQTLTLEGWLEIDLDLALQELGKVLTTFVVCPRCGTRTLLGRMDRVKEGVVCLDCSKEVEKLFRKRK